MKDGYDVAQYCLNGHVVNDSYINRPQDRAKHCSKCGAETIRSCASCDTPIKGRHSGSAFYFHGRPAFCRACGDPFPWTEAALAAAVELAREAEALSVEERRTLESSIEELVRDTPKTPLAANRYMRMMSKAGATVAAEFRALLVDVVSETAKKIIYPG